MVCFLSLYHLPPHSAKTTLPRAETQNAGKRGREERQKREKAGKAGKARGARPAPRKGTGAPPQTPPGGMIPPGPPQFAKVGLISTLWGPRPAFRRPGRWMQAGGRFRHAAYGLPSQCERVLPDPLTQAHSCPAFAGQSFQRKDEKKSHTQRPALCPGRECGIFRRFRGVERCFSFANVSHPCFPLLSARGRARPELFGPSSGIRPGV